MALLDHHGRPVRKSDLTREIATSHTASVRQPFSGTPADGLTPVRLAGILREADRGQGINYLELAEIIEERDLHYAGVLGTRKRAVSQIEVTVEPADESAGAEKHAAMIRRWLLRDELSSEIFNILDAIGKGYSVTEILWDTSESQYYPAQLEWRDPRWFGVAPEDLKTLMLLDDDGQLTPLPAFKFITAIMPAKSGLPLRSGLARIASWAWMFKAYTGRDWQIFTQTYGQPIRLGRFETSATEKDRNILMRAVRNIAGDCAAIIPESMGIEFVQPGNLSATGELYAERCRWIDEQISKAVLGQTSTTDALQGGLGSGKEHREVQRDIEAADARALAAILNRDLIRPWVDLEYGPQKAYPRLKIERPEEENLRTLSAALVPLIDRGLPVDTQSILDKFGLEMPKEGDEILRPQEKLGDSGADEDPNSKIKRPSAKIKRGKAEKPPSPPELNQTQSAGQTGAFFDGDKMG